MNENNIENQIKSIYDKVIDIFDVKPLKVNQEIQQLEIQSKEAQDKLENNNRFKSILYSTGDELVEVVFEILENMLGCDLSNFVDEKKADFIFELDDKVFIGEIKGINTNVKSVNVTQLEVHVQDYLDDNLDKTEEDIIALLIINHQREKSPDEREAIHEKQIALAKRNGSLIVETTQLLQLYSDYCMGNKNKSDIVELLKCKGLLQL